MAKVRKLIAIGTSIAAVLSITAAGIAVYWEKKLEPIMDSPSATLRLKPFEPVEVSETRMVDLGYARFALPDFVEGEPVRYDQSHFIGIGVKPGRSFVFSPPVAADHPEAQEMFSSLSSVVDTPITNGFELRRVVLEQQPFSTWEVPFMGLREAKKRTALLTAKVATNYLVTSVEIVRLGDRGALIFRAEDRHRLEVTDFVSGTTQGIDISASLPQIDSIISALVSEFEFVGHDFSFESVERLLAESDIPSIGSDTPESRRAEAELQERLDAVRSQVLTRRKQKAVEANQPPEATAGSPAAPQL